MVRATYTPSFLNIREIIVHFINIGVEDFRTALVTAPKESMLSLTKQDIEKLKKEYYYLSRLFLKMIKEDKYLDFGDLREFVNKVHSVTFHTHSCRAGRGYFTVSINGDLYPCHRVVGKREFLVGNVNDDIIDLSRLKPWIESWDVNSKEKCKSCWAKYFCGGGCRFANYYYNNDIFEPWDLMCELIKFKAEIAIMLYTELVEEGEEILEKLYKKGSLKRR